MPIISIFNGIFCEEEQVITELIQQTKYALIQDSDITASAGRLSNLSEAKISKAFSSKTSIFNKFTHERERSIAYLKLATAEALSHQELILEGFCTHLIPRELTHVLRVCIIADVKYRIATAAKQKGLSEAEAMKLIRTQDEERAAWVHMQAQAGDPWNAALYDILAPADKLSVAEIAQLIVENSQKESVKPGKRSLKAVDNFKLSAAVEVALADEGHHVGVKAEDGRVVLTINKQVLMLNRLEEELKSIAEKVAGVKTVATKVGPGFHQADIYRKYNFELPAKILLVDDEREFVQTLSERLLIRDMGSAVAYDGASALELIREDEPEVMILDLRMPGIDGIEVLKKVKQTNPNIEVIILTGHGSELDKEICMKLGAFAYLQKPVDIDELSETIKKANERIRKK